jgi:rod shape-determining protein MreC
MISSNFFSGGVYQQINDVSEYLNLRTENEALALENARLKSILFNTKDTSFLKRMDSIKESLLMIFSIESNSQLL